MCLIGIPSRSHLSEPSTDYCAMFMLCVLRQARAGNFEEAEVLLQCCVDAVEGFSKRERDQATVSRGKQMDPRTHETSLRQSRHASTLGVQYNRLSLVKLQLLKVKVRFLHSMA